MSKPKKKPDAFTDSDKHVLNGTKLHSWTPSRIIAGQAMGMLYPEIGKDGWDQYRRTKIYPGALRDTIICLWLCTRDETQVDEADSAPLDAYRQARTWATGLGIHKQGSTAFWQAYTKFAEIMGQVDESFTVPKKTDGDEESDEGNE